MAFFYSGQQLVPLKVVIFFLFAAIGALVPFLSIHVKELGMTAEETRFIYLVSGCFSLFGPIFGGILTERHGKFRPFIVVFIILSAASYTALLFIPGSVRTPARLPEFQFECDGNQISMLLEKCPNWEQCFATNLNLDSNFEALSCRYSCQENASFFKSADLCFKGQNKVQEMCRAFNASVKDETLKLSARRLFPRANSTRIVNLSKETEMCVYPISNITVSGYDYKGASCSYKKPGCQFVCTLRESASVKRKNSVYRKFPPCLEIYGDPFLTFYAYIALRSFADMCLMTVISLFDSVSVLSIAEFKGTYGRSRVWTALGLAIFGPVSGALIDHYSEVEKRVNYAPAFIIFDGFMLIAAILTISLPITKDIIANKIRSGCTKCLQICQSAEAMILYLLVLVLGMLWGCLDIFFYWYAFDIGGSKFMIGLTLTAAFLCSAPFLAFSDSIIRGFGKSNLIVYAFLFYCIRYVGYSFVTNPWWLLPFQVMEIFSISLMWIGVVAYAHNIALPGLRVTTQGTINALHFCVGRGLGGFIGGLLIQLFGVICAFRSIGVFSAVVGGIYWLAHICCFRKKYKRASVETASSGIALTGVYYPMSPDYDNPSAQRNRQTNGYATPITPSVVSDSDEEFQMDAK